MATILLIEDNASVRTAVARLLSVEGHTVLTAGGGAEGVELYRRDLPNLPDLVIVDTVMPGTSGDEVIRRVRDLQPQQPILRISASFEPNPSNIAGDPVPVLTKPFDADAFLGMVTSLLRHLN